MASERRPKGLKPSKGTQTAPDAAEEPVVPDGPGRPVTGAQSALFGEEGHSEERRKLIKGQYPFGEVASAFQKEIRRGAEREALFWGHLLYEAAPYYAWKRLLVTAAEDVGLAAPDTVEKVCGLALAWRICRERSYYVSPHHFTMAVVLLCRAPKSTEIEDLQTLVLDEIKSGVRRPIPEYARDAHTEAGRAAGKTWADWYFGRHVICGVPVNDVTRELWARRPEWHPDNSRVEQERHRGGSWS